MKLSDPSETTLRIGITAAGALAFFTALITAMAGNAAASTVMTGLFGLCLTFLFLSRFKRVKGPGFEAEMWEEKMHEAEQLIARLNRISLIVTNQLYQLMASRGRIGGPPTRIEQQHQVDQLDTLLSDAGLDRETIEAMKAPVHRVNLGDILRPAIDSVAKEIGAIIDRRREPMKKFKQPYGADAQAVQRDVLSKIGPLERLRSGGLWECLKHDDYTGVPARIENVIFECDALSSEEKERMQTLLEPALAEMRAYVVSRRWPLLTKPTPGVLEGKVDGKSDARQHSCDSRALQIDP